MSPVPRNLLHRLVVDHLAHACCRGINKRGVGGNLDCFRGLADAQLYVLHYGRRDFELEV